MQQVAGENDVAIVKKFSESIGEVVMDSWTIHRCLLNLVSNAIDACRFDGSGTKTHCVTVSTTIDSDNFIRFDVSDNGSGMTEEVKERLFGSSFSTKGSQGTGLGLLVSRKLIEEHDGTIDVTSQLGEGTTFIVRLPIKSEVRKRLPRYPNGFKFTEKHLSIGHSAAFNFYELFDRCFRAGGPEPTMKDP